MFLKHVSQHLESRIYILLSAVVAIIIIGTGVVAYNDHHKQKTASEPASNAYIYSKFNSYTYKGKDATSSMTFQKPVEFTAIKYPSPLDHQSLIHILSTGNHKAPVAGLYLISSSVAIVPKAQTAVELQEILSARFPASKITLAKATPFTNSHIKFNASQFDFSSTPTAKTSSVSQGTAVYIIGSKDYYYFILSANQSIWKANQSAWQTMLKSIVINQ